MPVIALFIARVYSYVLRGFVSPEITRGKSLVDAHFAIAMRHVHRFVKETQKDVAMP